MLGITLLHKIEKLSELKSMIEKIKAKVESIKDSIKEDTTSRRHDELQTEDFTVRYCDTLTINLIQRDSKLN